VSNKKLTVWWEASVGGRPGTLAPYTSLQFGCGKLVVVFFVDHPECREMLMSDRLHCCVV